MQVSDEEIRNTFRSLSDAELNRRASSGKLTAEAQAQADAELAYRRQCLGLGEGNAGRSPSNSGRMSGWMIYGFIVAAIAIIKFVTGVLDGKIQP